MLFINSFLQKLFFQILMGAIAFIEIWTQLAGDF